jgi:hypothetical protein
MSGLCTRYSPRVHARCHPSAFGFPLEARRVFISPFPTAQRARWLCVVVAQQAQYVRGVAASPCVSPLPRQHVLLADWAIGHRVCDAGIRKHDQSLRLCLLRNGYGKNTILLSKQSTLTAFLMATGFSQGLNLNLTSEFQPVSESGSGSESESGSTKCV